MNIVTDRRWHSQITLSEEMDQPEVVQQGSELGLPKLMSFNFHDLNVFTF